MLIVMARVPCDEVSSFGVYVFQNFFLNFVLWQLSTSVKSNGKIFCNHEIYEYFKLISILFFQVIYVRNQFCYVRHVCPIVFFYSYKVFLDDKFRQKSIKISVEESIFKIRFRICKNSQLPILGVGNRIFRDTSREIHENIHKSKILL